MDNVEPSQQQQQQQSERQLTSSDDVQRQHASAQNDSANSSYDSTSSIDVTSDFDASAALLAASYLQQPQTAAATDNDDDDVTHYDSPEIARRDIPSAAGTDSRSHRLFHSPLQIVVSPEAAQVAGNSQSTHRAVSPVDSSDTGQSRHHILICFFVAII